MQILTDVLSGCRDQPMSSFFSRLQPRLGFLAECRILKLLVISNVGFTHLFVCAAVTVHHNCVSSFQ